MGFITLFHSVLLIALIMPKTSMSSDLAGVGLTQSVNSFSLDLYKALGGSGGNLIVSPFSVHVLLSLVKQGARNVTAHELVKALYLPEDNAKTLESYKQLNAEINNSTDLDSATAMYVESSFEIKKDFQGIAQDTFSSEVQKADFKNNAPGAVKEINTWVENKTNNKIQNLITEDVIDPHSTVLILINAVYFKAKWQNAFDPNKTRPMPFYVTPDSPVDVQMMVLTDIKLRYLRSEELGAQIVEIPYKNQEFCMYIILPERVDGIKEVENKLNNTNLTKIFTDELQLTTLDLYLPRWKIESTIDLNQPLKNLGILKAFSGEADFSGISDKQSLYISQVLQKAFIEVNEEGTEAAASTAAVIMTRSMKFSHEFICNRPFTFMIAKRGTSIFIGKVSMADALEVSENNGKNERKGFDEQVEEVISNDSDD